MILTIIVIHLLLDWVGHYSSLDKEQPMWSGATYGFDVTKIPVDDWVVLEKVVGAHFELPESKSGGSHHVVFNCASQVTLGQL